MSQQDISLRDWLAGMALPAIISTASLKAVNDVSAAELRRLTAVAAYAFADAMLEQRGGKP